MQKSQNVSNNVLKFGFTQVIIKHTFFGFFHYYFKHFVENTEILEILWEMRR